MNIKRSLNITAVSILVLLIIILPIFGGCNNGTPADSKVLKIGVGMPLTGPMSMVGTIWTQGFELAFDKINQDGGLNIGGDKYQIKLFSEDSKSTPDGSTAAAIKLVNEQGVDILIGDIFDFDTPSFYKISSEAGILLVIPYGEISAALGGQTDVGTDKPLAIRLHPCDDETMRNPVEYLDENFPDVKTVGLLDIDFPGWEVLEPYCVSVLEDYGMEQSGALIRFPLDTIDFYPTITKLLESNPDAIYALHGTLDQFILIVKAARELKFEGPILHSTPYDVGLAIRAVPDLSNIFGNGVALDTPNLPSSIQNAIDLGNQKFGSSFVSESISAYDVGMLLAQLIEQAGSIDAETLQDKFETLTAPGSLESIYGKAHSGGLETCGANRIIVRPIPISRIDNGKGEYLGAVEINIP